MLARQVAVFLLVIGAVTVHGQRMRFQHITTDQGLGDNSITCLFEDRDGFLWIGTEQGVDRYDGNLVMPVADVHAHITSIAQDSSGMIWLGTLGNGLISVDRNGTQRHVYSATDGRLPTTRINALHVLDERTLLVGGSPVAVSFLDLDSGTFTPWVEGVGTSTSGEATSDWCHAFVPIGDTLLWAGMLNGQRSLVMRTRDRSLVRVLPKTVAVGEHHTRTCAVVLGDTLYSAGWQMGIERQRIGTWSNLPTLPTTDEVSAMAAWNGLLVVALKRGGLLVHHPGTNSTEHIQRDPAERSSLPSDRLRCVLPDRNGNLWVGTANGLAVHSPAAWPMEEQVVPAARSAGWEVHQLLPTPDGGLHVLGSVSRFGMFANGTHAGMGEGVAGLVHTRLSAPQGAFRLLGTETGLWRVQANTLKAETYFERTSGGMSMGGPDQQFQVRGVFADTLDGVPVWVVAALGYGVQVYRADDGAMIRAPDQLMPRKLMAMVRDMQRDDQGRYWCATDDGILCLDLHRNDSRTFGGQARALLLDGGTTWALTRDSGLVSITAERLRVHRLHQRRVLMNGLAMDDEGRIWTTTNDGLERYDPRTGSWLHVPVNDGSEHRKLPGPIVRLSNGHMAFATAHSILRFDPACFDVRTPPPAAYLVDLRSAERELVAQDGTITLGYREGVLDIRLSALHTAHTLPLRFIHRLEGVEDDLRETAAGEPIRYAGLPVGTHRLLVRTRDAFGQEGAEVVLLTVRIEGPFWQRWWFFAIAAALVSTVIFAWSRYRIAQTLRLQAVRNRIASDLHDEVGSSLSSITIGSQLAGQLSTGENEQVKALLARIGETSSSSLRSISDIVWAIDPKNDEGEALLKRMQRIAQELLERKGVKVTFSTHGVDELKLPMELRKEVLLIFKEAVHNASKYAEATHVGIELRSVKGRFSMSVRDNGRGFDTRLHPDGNGLGNMRRRAATLGSVLTVESTPGYGTYIALEVDLSGWRS